MGSRRGFTPTQIAVVVMAVLVSVCCLVYLSQVRAEQRKQKADFISDCRATHKALQDLLDTHGNVRNTPTYDAAKASIEGLKKRYNGTPWERKGYITFKLDHAWGYLVTVNGITAALEAARQLHMDASELKPEDIPKLEALAKDWLGQAQTEIDKMQ